MAIWGIGVTFSGKNKVDEFINTETACIGWDDDKAESLYNLKSDIKVGDIIYMKSSVVSKKEVLIYGVGIVLENDFQDRELKVRWTKAGKFRVPFDDFDKYNVKSNTLYQEYSPTVQDKIVNIVCGQFK